MRHRIMSSSSVHTVTEQVMVSTPIQVVHEDHLISWGILWGGYLVASVVCAYQVFLDRRALDLASDIEQGTGESSSGDTTRAVFYRLLLFALLSRVALIPLLMYDTEFTVQFFADTFGYLSFASAWMLLVSFFVQLVGAASGRLIYAGPSIMMQLIGYVVYAILCVTYLWNDTASVLLFALLCCIYAALFSTLIYFGPRLVALLRPSLAQRSGLAFRLIASCVMCLVIFAARTVFMVRMVIDPPKDYPWWWNYGCMELFPSVALLIMMHPNRQHSNIRRNLSPGNSLAGTPPMLSGKGSEGNRRSISANVGNASSLRGETGPLLKFATTYGSTGALLQGSAKLEGSL